MIETTEQLAAEYKSLDANLKNSALEGGRVTQNRAKLALAAFNAGGGFVRMDTIKAELQTRGVWDSFYAYNFRQVSFIDATINTPTFKVLAATAALAYGGAQLLTTPAPTMTSAAPAGTITSGGGAQVAAVAASTAEAAAPSLLGTVAASAGEVASGIATTVVTAKVAQATAPKPAPRSVNDAGVANSSPATSSSALPFALAALLGAVFIL